MIISFKKLKNCIFYLKCGAERRKEGEENTRIRNKITVLATHMERSGEC